MKLITWLEKKKWYIWAVLAISLLSSLLIVHLNKDKGVIKLSEENLDDKIYFTLFLLFSLATITAFYLLATISAFSNAQKSNFQRRWDKSFWFILSFMLPFIFYFVGYKYLFNVLINS